MRKYSAALAVSQVSFQLAGQFLQLLQRPDLKFRRGGYQFYRGDCASVPGHFSSSIGKSRLEMRTWSRPASRLATLGVQVTATTTWSPSGPAIR